MDGIILFLISSKVVPKQGVCISVFIKLVRDVRIESAFMTKSSY